jgi:hypothetical protein
MKSDSQTETFEEAEMAAWIAGLETQARLERRNDKAWLLRDLREHRRQAVGRLHRKTGFMHQVTTEGIARLERLIKMVKEMPE